MGQLLNHLSLRIGAVFRKKRLRTLTPADADKAWGHCIDDRQFGAKTDEFTYRPGNARDVKPDTTQA